jgi:hypothetical protein
MSASPLLPVRLCGALCLLALGACQDYLARKETIAWEAGNAVAANRAVHVIDPWPPASADARIEVSGRRVAEAIERYETQHAQNANAAPAPSMAPSMTP